MAKKRKFDENDARGNDDDRMEPELASNESKNENMLALLAKAANEMDIEGGEIDAEETSRSSGSVSPTPIQSKMTYTYVAGKNAGSTETGARKEKTLYRCDICGWSTVQLARYLKHKTASHAKKTEWTIRFSCAKCTFSTPLKSVLEDHERTKHAQTYHPSTAAMEIDKKNVLTSGMSTMTSMPSLYSGQRPIVISLPHSGAPSTSNRSISVGVEKLFDAFLEAVIREENAVMDRMARLQSTLTGLIAKKNSLQEESNSLTSEMSRLESEIVSAGYNKQKLVAVSVAVEDEAIQVEIDALEVKLLSLKETLASLTMARDITIKQSVDIEAQLASFSTSIEQCKNTFQTVQTIKNEFTTRKMEVDCAKHKVDELYRDILVTFARKNELELKRIMDPALDEKDALELLSTRHRIENDLQTKVTAFLDLRAKWNNGRSALAQYVQANKSKIVGLAA